jgi:hypothetical protein
MGAALMNIDILNDYEPLIFTLPIIDRDDVIGLDSLTNKQRMAGEFPVVPKFKEVKSSERKRINT